MNSSTVPSKIVIAGNSKLSLNERFANLPKPRPAAKNIHKQQNTRHAFQKNQVYEEVEYVAAAPRKKAFHRPRPAYVQQQQIPIENRLSYHQQPKIVYVPVASSFPQKNQQFRKVGFRNNFANQNQRTQFNRNNVNQNNQKPFIRRQPNQYVGFGFKARNNNMGANNRFKNQNQNQSNNKPLLKKKTVADLDKELDEYMRKPKQSKHTPITI